MYIVKRWLLNLALFYHIHRLHLKVDLSNLQDRLRSQEMKKIKTFYKFKRGEWNQNGAKVFLKLQLTFHDLNDLLKLLLDGWKCPSFKFNMFSWLCQCTIRQSPDSFIEYLTQNVIFHVKSHMTNHVFWELSILKSQHPMLPNLTRNETWNDTPLKNWMNGQLVHHCIWLDTTWRFNRIIAASSKEVSGNS